MNNWWKSPVLQGPENDYGDYDYLIEDIPDNSIEWSRYRHKCDECGKERNLTLIYTACFRTMDGWDSMESYECWRCYLKRKIKAPFKALKKKITGVITSKLSPRSEYYEMKAICEQNGRTLTKDLKKKLKNIAKREAARSIK